MSKVIIITDSSAYLPEEVIKNLPIEVIPMTLTWDGRTYHDRVDMQADEFYCKLGQSDSLPTTSAINVGAFQEVFQRNLLAGNSVLVLPISSGLSASLNSALQAQTLFPGAAVEVMETRLVSMALGFQVLAAARAAAQGASLGECRAVAEEAYAHIGVYFTVDTLTYLHKGGRINSAKRLLGTALNVKPMLEIRDGKIELVSSVISRRKALDALVQLVERGIAGRSPVRLSVFHAGVRSEAEALKIRTDELFQPVESILSEVSPAIGSHTGPGTIAIAYMAGM